jgi:hypothetical protein
MKRVVDQRPVGDRSLLRALGHNTPLSIKHCDPVPALTQRGMDTRQHRVHRYVMSRLTCAHQGAHNARSGVILRAPNGSYGVSWARARSTSALWTGRQFAPDASSASVMSVE